MSAPPGNNAGNENAGSLRWMPGHDEMLGRLVAEGVFGSQIAREINREFGTEYTRNAIIGRVHRLGIGHTRPVRQKKAGRKPQRRVKSADKQQSPQPIRTYGIKPLAPSCIPVPTGLRTADVTPRNIPLLELRRGDCRWPYGHGPFVFCGCPAVAEGSYCGAHLRLSRRVNA